MQPQKQIPVSAKGQIELELHTSKYQIWYI